MITGWRDGASSSSSSTTASLVSNRLFSNFTLRASFPELAVEGLNPLLATGVHRERWVCYM